MEIAGDHWLVMGKSSVSDMETSPEHAVYLLIFEGQLSAQSVQLSLHFCKSVGRLLRTRRVPELAQEVRLLPLHTLQPASHHRECAFLKAQPACSQAVSAINVNNS